MGISRAISQGSTLGLGFVSDLTMPRPRTLLLGLLSCAVAASLVACGNDPAASPPETSGTPTQGESPNQGQSTAEPGSLDAVQWQGKCGVDQAELVFEAPFAITDYTWRVIEDGTGETIQPGHRVAIMVEAYNAGTGDQEFSSAASGKPETIPLAGEGQDATDDPFYQALVGLKVGACLIMTMVDPNADGGPDPNQGMLVALTVTAATTVPARASGEEMPQTDPKLPLVNLAADGAPSIELPANTQPPTQLVVQELIKGTGPEVKLDQAITVHYTGWLWSDGSKFDSSWDRGDPATFDLTIGQLIDGWTTGLAGLTVGSQVLLVVPPDQGYGSTDRGTIPPDSTLVFVIDLLHAN